MRLGPIEIAGRESSLISPLAFSRHLHDVRRSRTVNVDYVSVSESRLRSLALSGPGGILGVTAGSRLHVCRRDRFGDFRVESWQYRNEFPLVGCEWYAADGAVAILADVSGHIRVLDVATSSLASDISFGAEISLTHLSMSPVDHTLFVACLDGFEGTRLVDIRSGSHSQILGVSRMKNDSARAATCSAWSVADQYHCVVGRADQTITMFDIRRPKPLYEIPSVSHVGIRPITGLQFNPFGSNMFASLCGDRVIGWRVDGSHGLCKPVHSHAFSNYRHNRPKHIQFAVSSDSVYFPDGHSINVFEQFGKRGMRLKEIAVGLGDLSAVLWDEHDQILYTSDDNGVVGVVTPKFRQDDADDNPIIEWESYSDDSDVEFPQQTNEEPSFRVC